MTVHKRAAAKRDLIQHYLYLVENAGLETADKFLRQVEETFSDLARHPAMGAIVPLSRARMAGIRKWQVKGFENFLIFYVPHQDRVSIIRVLYAAQDWWNLLGLL